MRISNAKKKAMAEARQDAIPLTKKALIANRKKRKCEARKNYALVPLPSDVKNPKKNRGDRRRKTVATETHRVSPINQNPLWRYFYTREISKIVINPYTGKNVKHYRYKKKKGFKNKFKAIFKNMEFLIAKGRYPYVQKEMVSG